MEWEKKITDNKFSKNTKSYCIYGSVEVFSLYSRAGCIRFLVSKDYNQKSPKKVFTPVQANIINFTKVWLVEQGYSFIQENKST